MRPDRGHSIVDDVGKKVDRRYSASVAEGFAELPDIMRTLETLRS